MKTCLYVIYMFVLLTQAMSSGGLGFRLEFNVLSTDEIGLILISFSISLGIKFDKRAVRLEKQLLSGIFLDHACALCRTSSADFYLRLSKLILVHLGI